MNSESGCIVFAKWVLCRQAYNRLNENDIKNNTRKYLKSMKRKQTEVRQRERINKHIRCLECDNDDSMDRNTLIHSLQLLKDELIVSDSDSNTSEDEE